MPWGEYRGVLLADVPLSYLVWVIEQEWAARQPQLLAAIRHEVVTRLKLNGTPPPSSWPVDRPPAELSDLLPRLVTSGLKSLAMVLHPDRGGSTIEMQRLNALREWFRRHGSHA
jgi:uncharacterized protein (DUF3820 family)